MSSLTKSRKDSVPGSAESKRQMQSVLVAASGRISSGETRGLLVVELGAPEQGLAVGFSLTPALAARMLAELPQVVSYVAKQTTRHEADVRGARTTGEGNGNGT